MDVIPKLIEGFDAIYITGSGQTKQTADRVKIYEVEGDVLPTKRFKWKAKDEFPLDPAIMGDVVQPPPRRIYKKRTTVKKESLTLMVKPTSGRSVLRGRGHNSQPIVSIPRRDVSSSQQKSLPHPPSSSQFNNYTLIETEDNVLCDSFPRSTLFPTSDVPIPFHVSQKEGMTHQSYESTYLQDSWLTDPSLFASPPLSIPIDSTWKSLDLYLPDDEWDTHLEDTDSGSDSSGCLSHSTSSYSSPDSGKLPTKKSVKFALDPHPMEPADFIFQYVFSYEKEAQMFPFSDNTTDDEDTHEISS